MDAKRNDAKWRVLVAMGPGYVLYAETETEVAANRIATNLRRQGWRGVTVRQETET